LENLNIAITHELKEEIIEGKLTNIFLENLLSAITAMATNPFFVNIFNCKYYNILPQLLDNNKIIQEICSIIHIILEKIERREIDVSNININLRFDEIEQKMGIDLSKFPKFPELLKLKNNGVESIIEIVSSVINDEDLRNIIAKYLVLIEQDDNLKRVCGDFGGSNAAIFMSLVISIMDFVETHESDEILDNKKSKILRNQFSEEYGEMGFDFIISYLCTNFCDYYTIILFDFESSLDLHRVILTGLTGHPDLKKIYIMYILLDSDKRPRVHNCLKECKKKIDEAKAKSKNISLLLTPVQTQEFSQSTSALNSIPPVNLESALGQSQFVPEERISPLLLPPAELIQHKSSRAVSEASLEEHPNKSPRKQSYSNTNTFLPITDSKDSNMDHDGFNIGGKRFTRGRKQKVNRFTKGRNRKLRKISGTRKTYRKKNKTRRR
jgi:hypothetical protein